MSVAAPPGPWVAPVSPIVVEQRYVASAPYAAGGHRPVVLRARRGSSVVAPCGGVVTFRGRVAGGPPSLTVQCGRLLATLSRIDAAVSRGSLIGAGDPVGAVAGTAGVGLSAHTAGGAYRDPLPLLGANARRSRSPVLVARRERSRRRAPADRAAAPAASRAPAHLPANAYVARAGSTAAAGTGPRPGRRERAGPAAASTSASPRVDLPAGLAGGAAASLFAALWGWALLRGRRPRRHLPRLLHLARARR